ncbi:MAG: hypothetical protein HWE13_00415 [Gammaproteobacteria bacterium]|nr:hypothetical protein [Gammaproteobacteria bacterium]NVK86550.1 hypothetical protein [Gammaproteobacteria bacterium]
MRILTALAVLALLTAWGWWRANQSLADQSSVMQSESRVTSLESASAPTAVKTSPLGRNPAPTEMTAEVNSTAASASELSLTVSDEFASVTGSAWRLNDNDLLDYKTFPHPKVLQFDAIALDAEAILLAEAGERLELPVTADQKLQGQVANNTIDRRGNVVVTGYLEGYGDRYPFIITHGEQSTFAMVTSPQGSFSIETVNGIGWVYQNPSEEELSAPGYNDERIPHRAAQSE